MKKSFIAAAFFAALAAPAFAQSAGPSSGSTSGANSSIQNTNAPTIITNVSTPAGAGLTGGSSSNLIAERVDNNVHTNQAATAATVFVNPPAADTCAKAGSGFSAQGVGAGFGVSLGGSESVKCDMRADTINLKVTGAPQAVIKARQCMDAQMAEAYARAGDACEDKRPAHVGAASGEMKPA